MSVETPLPKSVAHFIVMWKSPAFLRAKHKYSRACLIWKQGFGAEPGAGTRSSSGAEELQVFAWSWRGDRAQLQSPVRKATVKAQSTAHFSQVPEEKRMVSMILPSALVFCLERLLFPHYPDYQTQPPPPYPFYDMVEGEGFHLFPTTRPALSSCKSLNSWQKTSFSKSWPFLHSFWIGLYTT